MPYVSCPRCEVRIEGRFAYTIESCPLCLARDGSMVGLEAHLGEADRQGRFVRTVREELAERGGAPGRRSPGR